jgi:hypothetical protein
VTRPQAKGTKDWSVDGAKETDRKSRLPRREWASSMAALGVASADTLRAVREVLRNDANMADLHCRRCVLAQPNDSPLSS